MALLWSMCTLIQHWPTVDGPIFKFVLVKETIEMFMWIQLDNYASLIDN